MNIKKMICFLQMVILLTLSALPVHAYEVSAEPENTNSSITEIEAVELAKWFIANDIYENGNDGWSEETVICDVEEDIGYYNNSYIVNLKANNTDNGYYTSSDGTMPYYIDNLATAVWTHYGYSGKGNNDFVFTSTESLKNTLKSEIDGNRPGTISFTSGTYGDHTVTYYGYNIYSKTGTTSKLYLKVNDNWSTSAKYVDISLLGSSYATMFEICKVIP